MHIIRILIFYFSWLYVCSSRIIELIQTFRYIKINILITEQVQILVRLIRMFCLFDLLISILYFWMCAIFWIFLSLNFISNYSWINYINVDNPLNIPVYLLIRAILKYSNCNFINTRNIVLSSNQKLSLKLILLNCCPSLERECSVYPS